MRTRIPLHWGQRFIDLAITVASWSKDPSTKVGCVLVDGRRRVISMGYNGFPETCEDKPEWYADKAIKYPTVIHAEMNAVTNATAPVAGSVAFLTHPPCVDCAKLLIANRVREIHYVMPSPDLLSRWADSLKAAEELVGRCNPSDAPAPMFTMFGWMLLPTQSADVKLVQPEPGGPIQVFTGGEDNWGLCEDPEVIDSLDHSWIVVKATT